MEPTQWGFLLPVILVAVAALTATVVLWPRFGRGGVRAVAARSGLVLASQGLLTAAIVLVANKYFVFYPTWDDLLGGDGGRVQVNSVQSDQGREARPDALVHRTTTDLAPRRRGHDPSPAKDGQVDRLQIKGARSGLDAEAYVYLPPEYFRAEYKDKRLPVVLLLSGGASDGKQDWIKQAKLPEQAARAVADGHARPTIYVMTRSHRALTQTTEPPAGAGADKGLRKHPTTVAAAGGHPPSCFDVPGHGFGQAETFYTQDLTVAVADTYRTPVTRRGWAVAGFGTSGQCAARYAMLHSDAFVAGVSLNGTFDLPGGPVAPRPGGPRADLYGGSRTYRQDNDLLWRLENLPQPPVSLLLGAGDDSGRPLEQAGRFAGLAKEPLRAEKLAVPGPGGSLKDWRGTMPKLVTWLNAHLAAE
ncbi:alpha/beta hydrolase-fold protein [Actinomadura kijaniata]|uniref:alpha/beta hydrolase n=1 Tax=Actinomadura kijaniata TaxID=46161 RepID=UPI002FE8A4F4